jgi:hypothetical protein
MPMKKGVVNVANISVCAEQLLDFIEVQGINTREDLEKAVEDNREFPMKRGYVAGFAKKITLVDGTPASSILMSDTESRALIISARLSRTGAKELGGISFLYGKSQFSDYNLVGPFGRNYLHSKQIPGCDMKTLTAEIRKLRDLNF